MQLEAMCLYTKAALGSWIYTSGCILAIVSMYVTHFKAHIVTQVNKKCNQITTLC